MDLSGLNWLAIAIAFVAAFIASFIWFGPKTFYPIWWQAMGRTPEDTPGSSSMGVVFGLTALSTFIYTVVTAWVVHVAGAHSLGAGAVTGFIIGAGVAATSSLGHRLFAGHGLKVWAIEVGSDVLNFVIIGAIVGVMH